MPTSNDDFGKKNGAVRIVEKSTGNTLCQRDSITLFFAKNEMNKNDPSVPNWFYYWGDAIDKSLLKCPGIKLFDQGKKMFSNTPKPYDLKLIYDGSKPYTSIKDNEEFVAASTTTNKYFLQQRLGGPAYTRGVTDPVVDYHSKIGEINMRDACGYKFVEFESGIMLKGIDAFYTTFIHEREHHMIMSELWTKYTLSHDSDEDGDGYPDRWEDEPMQMAIGFNSKKDNSYEAYKPNKNGITVSAGTNYEERRCRKEQIKHIGKMKAKDWSFDKGFRRDGKKEIIQGQQW